MFLTPITGHEQCCSGPLAGHRVIGKSDFSRGHLRFKARWDGFRAGLGGNQRVSLSSSSGNNQDPAVQWGEPPGLPNHLPGLSSSVSISLFPFLAWSLSLPLSSLAFSVSSFYGGEIGRILSLTKNNVMYLAKAHTWHELKTFQFPH